jgi:hypothetical protein
VGGEDEAAERGRGHAGGAGAGHAQPGERSSAQHQRRREQEVQGPAPDHGDSGEDHDAGAPDHARQRVDHPEGGGSAEHHPAIGDRRIQDRAAAAHERIEPRAEGEGAGGEDPGHGEGDEQGMGGESIGVVTPARAERASQRRGHSPPMPADMVCMSITRGKTSGDPGQRVGPPTRRNRRRGYSPWPVPASRARWGGEPQQGGRDGPLINSRVRADMGGPGEAAGAGRAAARRGDGIGQQHTPRIAWTD